MGRQFFPHHHHPSFLPPPCSPFLSFPLHPPSFSLSLPFPTTSSCSFFPLFVPHFVLFLRLFALFFAHIFALFFSFTLTPPFSSLHLFFSFISFLLSLPNPLPSFSIYISFPSHLLPHFLLLPLLFIFLSLRFIQFAIVSLFTSHLLHTLQSSISFSAFLHLLLPCLLCIYISPHVFFPTAFYLFLQPLSAAFLCSTPLFVVPPPKSMP